MTTNATPQTFLVAGATGSVGREVVRELLERGHTVRALTRNPSAAQFPPGVEVVGGDLADPGSLGPALDGVTGLHLITFTGGGYQPLETGPEIVALARKAGVRRLTVLNGGGPTPLEDAVRESGLDWTVAMPVEFMANALGWADSIRTEATVRAAFVDNVSAMVHEADIGAVIATALSEKGHAGQVYLVTGPQALTVREKVAALAAATGREISLVELSEAQALEKYLADGLDESTAAWMIDVFKNTPPEGRTVIDTVQRVTGRPARPFSQWATEHADAFRA
ncbi:NAD(P)H-binding protein [Streptomyces sp. NPDC051561]|uniref:NmrA family NAD(P)-binding protein n=1 Tax=Streptomyces sp. NPDC051561 TaxID=3365658 RepID=UPI0037A9A6AC